MRSILVTLFGFVALLAQHPVDGSRGKELFVRYCSACHGDTGKGGRAPDLTSGSWKHGSSDEDLVRNITKGIAGTQMPAIPMADADVRAIVGFLRSLTGGAADEIRGNIAAGLKVFDDQCATCHMFNGAGAILASDLSGSRARHKPAGLLTAMSQPIVYTEAGPIRGVKKGEDTFTMQILDANRKWHSIEKADSKIRTVEARHPSLSPAQRNDVLAFLLKSPITGAAPPKWIPDPNFNVTFDRLRNPEPQNWLSYWGDLRGTHSSALKQITPANVGTLKSVWTYQFGGPTIETTPLVVDGMMFVTGPLNDAAALDARSGRPLWKYTRRLPKVASHCTVMTNRGFGILGDRLYMATLDMHLVALDAKSGNVIFDVEIGDYKKGLSNTHAPLVIDGKVIVGVTAGECALTGYVDAYDAATGERLWRTYSTPQPGDPNRKTWEPETSAVTGGAPTWMTGTYDADTDTLFWTTGNPGPDYDGSVRGGDNLYSCSVLALDAKTGRMKWWFQFTPHDVHDWDGNQTPMLIDGIIAGVKRKLLVTAQRNAFYYVLDRTTGEFVTGQAFAKQTWAKGLDAKGRPIVLPNTTPTPQGNYVCPDAAGAANWGSPSYDPATGYFLVSTRESCATYTSVTKKAVPGEGFTGGGQELDPKVGTPGAVRALHALTGARAWDFPLHVGASSTGVLATAGGVVFASSNDGYLIALESTTGKYLWRYNTGANIIAAPISYEVDGKQYVSIASQSAMMTFMLP